MHGVWPRHSYLRHAGLVLAVIAVRRVDAALARVAVGDERAVGVRILHLKWLPHDVREGVLLGLVPPPLGDDDAELDLVVEHGLALDPPHFNAKHFSYFMSLLCVTNFIISLHHTYNAQ